MKTRLYFSGLVATVSLCSALYATTSLAAKPESDLDKFSYSIGFQIGQGLKRDGLEVNAEVLGQAVRDVLEGKQPQMAGEEMRATMISMQHQMEAKRKQQAEMASAKGNAYLEANKAKPGVTTLPSGLQYKVIKTGTGKQPSATDSITAHYQGALIDGTVFDSSYNRGKPATFNVNQVIKGWQEVLPLMHEGDKWQVVIPAALAYGETGAGSNIGPNETLVFDIELIKVN